MKKTRMICAVLIVLLLCGCGKTGSNNDNSDPKTVPSSDELTGTAMEDITTATIVNPSATENATKPDLLTEETTSSGIDDWKNAPSDQLYYPGDDYLIENHRAFVFCIDTDVQDYVKMRFGPSKTDFEVTGFKMSNYGYVIVKSLPVNGWCFCEIYEEKGWIRSDFLFTDMNDILPLIPDGKNVPGGIYKIDLSGVTGEEMSVDIKEQPDEDAASVVALQDGASIRIDCDVVNQDGWVYARGRKEYSDYEGYVKLKNVKYLESGAGDKPVLYLYPEQKTDVDVTIKLAESVHFTCTYPDYRNGWHVTAFPNGILTDRATQKEYSYLFWELEGSVAYDFSSGFVVKGSETAEFLEKTLTRIGLSAKERNEFIVYWLPRMQNNPYNLISFQREAYTSLVDLQISPKPDSLLRVFMAYKPLTEPVEIQPQHFDTFERTGFVAVEWGGVECSY